MCPRPMGVRPHVRVIRTSLAEASTTEDADECLYNDVVSTHNTKCMMLLFGIAC